MKRTVRAQRIAAALGVGALAVLAACGSGGGGTTPTAEATQTGAVNGGTLAVGVLQEPTSFLAAGIVDSMTYAYAVDAPVAEGLLWYRSKDETQNAKTLADFWRPDLATEVPTTVNGDVKTSGCRNVTFAGRSQTPKMCVTWKLRDNVLWHDGTQFSSKDVCDTFGFYWQRYQSKNPTTILSPTGWQETIGCDDSNRLQAVVSYRSTYGGYLGQATGVYGILPSKLLQNAFNGAGGAGADLEKTPQTVNLSLGSGNTDAFTGTETLDKMIDGTGPYVFQKYEPGKDIILVRNKKYWDTRHQPHLDKVIMKFVPDTKAQLDQARAGEIQFGMDYRLALLKDLNDTARNGRLRVETIPESGAEKIDLNLCDNAKGLCGDQATKSPFTADIKVRQAMIKAIDRQTIVKTIAQGETVVPQDSWIYLGAEFIRTTPAEDPTTAYDLVGARKLLDDAGYKLSPSCKGGLVRADSSGRCMVLNFVTTSGNTARQNAQIAVQAMLQLVGIDTNLSDVKSGKLFGNFADGGLLYTHQFQMAMYTNTLSTPAEPDSWYAGYHADCGGSCPEFNQIPSAANNGFGQDDTGENNPGVDNLFDQARSTVDLAQRAKAYKQAEGLLAKDLPEIPLYQQVVVNSETTRLHGVQPNDLVWTFNMYDWYCDLGNCQG
ncbi:MAG: peptide/nickel transport system substrate-binding protein [Chloroflexota bacterium]|jgi:peptide/nickel transport system substrate-binding protein|nr:peptide/nickel transport system substrate-binding protein [Chloroflexota bacterium]